MAAKKSGKKASAKRSAAGRSGAKKKTARKAAKKASGKSAAKAGGRKAGGRKAGASGKAKAAKKAAPRKAAARKASPDVAAEKAPRSSDAAAKSAAPTRRRGKFDSLQVNLGHVFALRPRVETSFKPADFRTAKHMLEEEGYPTLDEAARAVAEKALELTHDGGPNRALRPKRA